MSVVRETHFSANPPDTVLCAVVLLWYEKQQKLSAPFVQMWEDRTEKIELSAADFHVGAIVVSTAKPEPGFTHYSSTYMRGHLNGSKCKQTQS